MFKTYYGLSCNPFDKQNLKERDCFLSHDHKEMTSRLDYLKEIREIGVFTARPSMGKYFALRCFAASLSTNLLSNGVFLPIHHLCDGILQTALRLSGRGYWRR